METGSLRISDIRPDFIYMMEQAVKAPSGHNTQPWLFRVQKDRIQILPDMSKSLPSVDPDGRRRRNRTRRSAGRPAGARA